MTAPVDRKTRRAWESRLFMTVAEAAAELGVDPRTLRHGIEGGDIPAVRIGSTIRIPVARFLAEVVGIIPDSTNGPDATSEPLAEVRALTKNIGGSDGNRRAPA